MIYENWVDGIEEGLNQICTAKSDAVVFQFAEFPDVFCQASYMEKQSKLMCQVSNGDRQGQENLPRLGKEILESKGWEEEAELPTRYFGGTSREGLREVAIELAWVMGNVHRIPSSATLITEFID